MLHRIDVDIQVNKDINIQDKIKAEVQYITKSKCDCNKLNNHYLITFSLFHYLGICAKPQHFSSVVERSRSDIDHH